MTPHKCNGSQSCSCPRSRPARVCPKTRLPQLCYLGMDGDASRSCMRPGNKVLAETTCARPINTEWHCSLACKGTIACQANVANLHHAMIDERSLAITCADIG